MEIPYASLNYIINKYLISRLTTNILMTSTCMRTCIEVLKKKIQWNMVFGTFLLHLAQQYLLKIIGHGKMMYRMEDPPRDLNLMYWYGFTISLLLCHLTFLLTQAPHIWIDQNYQMNTFLDLNRGNQNSERCGVTESLKHFMRNIFHLY